MKEFTKKNQNKIIILLIVISLFAWFELRPIRIKQDCASKVAEIADSENFNYDDFDFWYEICLVKNGL